MNSNVSIVTDKARAAASADVVGYGDGVAAHLNGDYGEHSQVKVYATAYLDSNGDTDAANSLRILLTSYLADPVNPSEIAFILPAVSGTATTVSGAPFIISGPDDAVAFAGASTAFVVGAVSQSSISYQWQKNRIAVNGATASQLVLTGVSDSDEAKYRVIVTNSSGTITSREATLIVNDPPEGDDDSWTQWLLPPIFRLTG